VKETNATGAVVARYSQTQNIDEPLAMLRSAATSYYHADGLGSVTSLSSAAGSIANTYTYDSFGKLTASTGSLVNPFRYTARESDIETGLYYYRARYYDQTTGRFVSEDPIGFRAGKNFYRYVRNSAINRSDPSGMYTLQNFTPQGAAQMTIAIGKLVAKLNSSCCIDPDVRRRIFNHLQPFSYGSGATITYQKKLVFNNRELSGQAQPFFDDIWISEAALNGSDTCPLEGIILHELTHLTWHNAWLGVKDPKLAEADAVAKTVACYGSGCQEAPEQ
jgi:RHS repeat-associated protein